MNIKIPFNRPFIAGKELYYIAQAVTDGQIAADGSYTRRCAEFLEGRFGVERALLTPSATAALEMAAMLCGLGEGDEVIMPSFTFVSTASAVVRTGARPRFVDIRPDTLNLDEKLIEGAINASTKMILPVHYAGVGCEMDPIMDLARAKGLRVVEDAAQGVNAYYKGQALGSIADLGAYSFHETKNYICGEGGALTVNDESFVSRAEIIRDKGTNRQQFFRGQVDKYTWVDLGSSYVPSEISAAFLWAQLEQTEAIATRRCEIYSRYRDGLRDLAESERITLPEIPPHCASNYHMMWLLLPNGALRDALMGYLAEQGIQSVFHYIPLHDSPAGLKYAVSEGDLPVTIDISARLLRLPFYYELRAEQQDEVIDHVRRFLASV